MLHQLSNFAAKPLYEGPGPDLRFRLKPEMPLHGFRPHNFSSGGIEFPCSEVGALHRQPEELFATEQLLGPSAVGDVSHKDHSMLLPPGYRCSSGLSIAETSGAADSHNRAYSLDRQELIVPAPNL